VTKVPLAERGTRACGRDRRPTRGESMTDFSARTDTAPASRAEAELALRDCGGSSC